jgi:hypothetical protein
VRTGDRIAQLEELGALPHQSVRSGAGAEFAAQKADVMGS